MTARALMVLDCTSDAGTPWLTAALMKLLQPC